MKHPNIVRLLTPYEHSQFDGSSWTALMWAAKTGRIQSAEYLADFESDVQNEGKKASDYAQEAGLI